MAKFLLDGGKNWAEHRYRDRSPPIRPDKHRHFAQIRVATHSQILYLSPKHLTHDIYYLCKVHFGWIRQSQYTTHLIVGFSKKQGYDFSTHDTTIPILYRINFVNSETPTTVPAYRQLQQRRPKISRRIYKALAHI